MRRLVLSNKEQDERHHIPQSSFTSEKRNWSEEITELFFLLFTFWLNQRGNKQGEVTIGHGQNNWLWCYDTDVCAALVS